MHVTLRCSTLRVCASPTPQLGGIRGRVRNNAGAPALLNCFVQHGQTSARTRREDELHHYDERKKTAQIQWTELRGHRLWEDRSNACGTVTWFPKFRQRLGKTGKLL